MDSSAVDTYSFFRNIVKYDAFDAYLRARLPTFNGFYAVPETQQFVLSFTATLTVEDKATIDALVAAYVDPEAWLVLANTSEQFLSTDMCNSLTPVVLQSFIVSPYNSEDAVMDSIKTVVNFKVDDISGLASVPTGTVFSATIELFNFTLNKTVMTVVKDFTSKIEEWKQEAIANGASGLRTHWSTAQFFGLRTLVPGSDNIWQARLSVSHPAVSASLNSMQRLFYHVS